MDLIDSPKKRIFAEIEEKRHHPRDRGPKKVPKLKTRKVAGPENDGFAETLKYYVMHQANVESNHNKYYVVECQRHPDGRYRIFTHYGRLGISNIYEVRETMEGGVSIYDEQIAMNELEKIHKKKLRGKSVTDPDTGQKVRECYVDVDVVSPTVGSENIRGSSDKVVSIKQKKAAIDTSVYTDKKVLKIVNQLIDENVHSITSHSSITYTATGGFQTSLGPVTPEHVAEARKPLDSLNTIMGSSGKADPGNREVRRLNSYYFSLIPKPFSRKITEEDMILDARQLQGEYDILDQLATGVSMGSAMSGSAAQKMNALGTEIELLEDPKEIKRITKYVRDSRADNHRGRDVWCYDVKTIFEIRVPSERDRFERVRTRYGNVHEFFHSSASSNCLSILKSGLIIPPVSAGHVTGRMMGNGIYASSSSSKALNYGIGFWGGKRSSADNAFLFVVNFAMGNVYETYSACFSGPPHGYDSLWAKPGRSLYNPEQVVYRLEQASISYLVEMTPYGR